MSEPHLPLASCPGITWPISVHSLQPLCLGLAGFVAATAGVVTLGFIDAPFLIAPLIAAATAAALGRALSGWFLAPGHESGLRAGLAGLACAGLSMVIAAILFVLMLAAIDGPGSDFLDLMLTGIVFTQIACGLFAYPLGLLAGFAAWWFSRERAHRPVSGQGGAAMP